MNNTLTALSILVFLVSACGKSEKIIRQKTNNITTNKIDSTIRIVKTSSNEENLDPPIKIIKTQLVQNQYSNHKDAIITFKNSGKKNIKAIKFEYFCINSFDEPAKGRSFYGGGRFEKKSIHLLKSNQTRTEHWEDFSTDADKIIKARAYYVVFTDGTKWKYKD